MFFLWWIVYFALMWGATQNEAAFWGWVAWSLIAFFLSASDPNPKKKRA